MKPWRKWKASVVRKFAKQWTDAIGIRMFGTRGVPHSVELTRKCLARAVGWDDFDTDEVMTVGERITNLMHLIYGRCGFTEADEFDVPVKHLEPPPAGPSKGPSIATYLSDMVDDCNNQIGWNAQTGFPTTETLKRMEMDESVEYKT